METYEKTDNVVPWKWALRQYESNSGRQAIADFRKQMAQGRFKAALDTFLRTLAKQERWEPPHIKALTGEYSGLSELRWTAGQKEHRIIGYRIDDTKDGQHQYVMLISCTHKQRNYIPPNALHTAKKRKAEIEKGVARINEYSLIADR